MTVKGTPWWEAMAIRPEIISASGQIDDVQMSLGDAVYGLTNRPAYADVENYGAFTHPTPRLVDLLAKIAIRLGGGSDDYLKAHSLTRLNQGMGGGKSHAEIGAWHMAAHPVGFFQTDIGQAVAKHAKGIIGRDLPHDLNNPVVVVLDLDKGTPGATKQEIDGPFAKNLYERFLWRLFRGDANKFKDFREFFSDKAKMAEAIADQGRPVLIVIDEIMDYVGNGLTGVGDDKLTAQDMAFLRAILDVVNDVPNVAMLVAMIDPEKDRISLSKDGKERQADLNTLLDRNGKPATVNEDTDFTAILRRRLFVNHPDPGSVHAAAKAYETILKDKGWAKQFDAMGQDWTKKFAAEVDRSYPFHPQLMHLAEQEWAKHSGYQNVRATIKVFAATVYAHAQAAAAGYWAPSLIGPGDLPLWDSTVRENILGSGLISDSSLEQNYRSIFQGDITTLRESDVQGGQARLLDQQATTRETWAAQNPHAHERAATFIAIASLMPRGQGRRGASEAEVLVASSVPDLSYGVGDAQGVLDRLTDLNSEAAMSAVETIPGKGGQRPRYLVNPETGVNVIYKQIRQAVTTEDRDNLIAITAQDISNSGPFKKKPFVHADRSLPTDEARRDIAMETLANAGLDDARVNRLVILDPAGFSLRNGMDEATKAAVASTMGLGDSANPVEWASSAVFAVVNTQRRARVRAAAAEYLAWKRTEESPELAQNENARAVARERRQDADAQLRKDLRRAFQHILYLAQPTADAPRELAEITLEEDALTALDGTTVWKELAEKQKAFRPGEFTGDALVFNLRDQDYGRPLSELRDMFWQAPRLPLLAGGEADLRNAIYDAIRADKIRLVDADGTTVDVDNPESINLSSQGRRLAKPIAVEPCTKCGKTDCDGTCDSKPDVCSKCGKPGCDGKCDQACAYCGKTTCSGECQEPAVTQRSIKFTLAHEVTPADQPKIIDVIGALYAALMSGDATFIQGTTEIVTTAENADAIAAAAESLGIKPTTRDL